MNDKQTERRYIDYLEHILGPAFLEEIGFYQLEDQTRPAIIDQLVDLLGTSLSSLVAQELLDRPELGSLAQMIDQKSDIFDIYDYLAEQIPDIQQKASFLIEQFKQELRQQLQ